MKRKLELLLEKYFSGFLPYQVIMGSLLCYREKRMISYRSEDFLHYGENIFIQPGAIIGAPERLYLGDNVGIASEVWINAVGGCHIGRGCQIAAQSLIFTVEHQYTGGESLPYDSVRLVKPVYIEDYVWVGFRSVIGPGVRIGEGAIIGMGSVVFQDVPPLAIVAGNPAQVLTYRSKEQFERVKQTGATVVPFKEMPLLRVPPITRRKFKDEIKDLGFDISNGQEYFYYQKLAGTGKRLIPVDEKGRSKIVA